MAFDRQMSQNVPKRGTSMTQKEIRRAKSVSSFPLHHTLHPSNDDDPLIGEENVPNVPKSIKKGLIERCQSESEEYVSTVVTPTMAPRIPKMSQKNVPKIPTRVPKTPLLSPMSAIEDTFGLSDPSDEALEASYPPFAAFDVSKKAKNDVVDTILLDKLGSKFLFEEDEEMSFDRMDKEFMDPDAIIPKAVNNSLIKKVDKIRGGRFQRGAQTTSTSTSTGIDGSRGPNGVLKKSTPITLTDHEMDVLATKRLQTTPLPPSRPRMSAVFEDRLRKKRGDLLPLSRCRMSGICSSSSSPKFSQFPQRQYTAPVPLSPGKNPYDIANQPLRQPSASVDTRVRLIKFAPVVNVFEIPSRKAFRSGVYGFGKAYESIGGDSQREGGCVAEKKEDVVRKFLPSVRRREIFKLKSLLELPIDPELDIPSSSSSSSDDDEDELKTTQPRFPAEPKPSLFSILEGYRYRVPVDLALIDPLNIISVTGPPGTGKTSTVEHVLDKENLHYDLIIGSHNVVGRLLEVCCEYSDRFLNPNTYKQFASMVVNGTAMASGSTPGDLLNDHITTRDNPMGETPLLPETQIAQGGRRILHDQTKKSRSPTSKPSGGASRLAAMYHDGLSVLQKTKKEIKDIMTTLPVAYSHMIPLSTIDTTKVPAQILVRAFDQAISYGRMTESMCMVGPVSVGGGKSEKNRKETKPDRYRPRPSRVTEYSSPIGGMVFDKKGAIEFLCPTFPNLAILSPVEAAEVASWHRRWAEKHRNVKGLRTRVIVIDEVDLIKPSEWDLVSRIISATCSETQYILIANHVRPDMRRISSSKTVIPLAFSVYSLSDLKSIVKHKGLVMTTQQELACRRILRRRGDVRQIIDLLLRTDIDQLTKEELDDILGPPSDGSDEEDNVSRDCYTPMVHIEDVDSDDVAVPNDDVVAPMPKRRAIEGPSGQTVMESAAQSRPMSVSASPMSSMSRRGVVAQEETPLRTVSQSTSRAPSSAVADAQKHCDRVSSLAQLIFALEPRGWVAAAAIILADKLCPRNERHPLSTIKKNFELMAKFIGSSLSRADFNLALMSLKATGALTIDIDRKGAIPQTSSDTTHPSTATSSQPPSSTHHLPPTPLSMSRNITKMSQSQSQPPARPPAYSATPFKFGGKGARNGGGGKILAPPPPIRSLTANPNPPKVNSSANRGANSTSNPNSNDEEDRTFIHRMDISPADLKFLADNVVQFARWKPALS